MEEATDNSIWIGLVERRLRSVALFHNMRTAVGKFAADVTNRRFDRGRWITVAMPGAFGHGTRDRIHKQLGVGVFGILHHMVHSTSFTHRTVIEHDHVVADLVTGGEVVGNVDDRDAKFFVQFLQVAEDRRP